MKKPTTGSVTAPQALPMNSTMEAWKALICRAERGQTGVKNTRWHTTHQLVYSFIGSHKQFSLSTLLNTLPERCRAGRSAGRRPWRWQPPPWALRRWRNTACCITSTCGPAQSVKTEVTREKGKKKKLNKIMTTLKVRLLMSKLTFLYCKQSDEDVHFKWEIKALLSQNTQRYCLLLKLELTTRKSPPTWICSLKHWALWKIFSDCFLYV